MIHFHDPISTSHPCPHNISNGILVPSCRTKQSEIRFHNPVSPLQTCHRMFMMFMICTCGGHITQAVKWIGLNWCVLHTVTLTFVKHDVS